MPWQARWRIIGAIKPSKVFFVESLADGVRAVLKTAPLRDAYTIVNEIVSLERLHAAGAAVPQLIDHNLATFHSSDAPLFVVMEYIEGVTLAKLNTITPAQMECITATVNTAHSLGIAHKDITPNNVMIRHDSEPVIVDWAMSQHLEARGTPIAPTAPEQWRDVAAGDLLTLENLPETLFREFIARRA